MVKMIGDIILPDDAQLPLKAGSCLNVYVQEEVYCLYCENPILSEYKRYMPQVKENRLSYTLEVGIGEIKSGRFVLQATLNNGWCGSDNEWIRYNDFHNEYINSVEVQRGTTSVHRDIFVQRYQSKRPCEQTYFIILWENIICSKAAIKALEQCT